MFKLKSLVAACTLASAFVATSTLSAHAGDLAITPGAFLASGSGFGGNISTSLAPLGGTAELKGAATIKSDSHNTSFGLGLDAIGHQAGVYYGAGANVFF